MLPFTLNAIRRISLVVLGLVLAALPGFAQVSGALLSGTVTDASGGVVPNAQVAVRNVATRIERTGVTGNNGLYSVPNLIPGVYDITIKANGFRTEERRGVVLNVGANKVVDCTLTVGRVTEQVVVRDVAPLLQLGSSESTTLIDSDTVRQLPLNGRSWTDLAMLEPGVSALEDSWTTGVGVDRALKGFGSQLSVSGDRPVQNNYRLDGISINDYANDGPSNVLGGALGVDAIQEFSVITSNTPAQYGRTSGGVINAVTRPGTNDFHGSVYEFVRNSALDARNYFDYLPNGTPYKAPFRRNQFGGSAGGPIKKNRTFIFGDYEGIRQSKGIATQAVVPSAAARTGHLTTGTVTVDPAVAKYLPLYPLPNVPSALGDAGIYSFTAKQEFTENFFTTKVDHSLSQKNLLSGTYLFDESPYSLPDSMDLTLKGFRIRRQTVALAGTQSLSPRLVNTFHVGLNRVYATISQNMAVINALAADNSLSSVPGKGPSRIFLQGFTLMPGGINGLAEAIHGYTSYQAYDDLFLTHGSHNLKLGVALEDIRNNTDDYSNSGDWTFGSLSSLLANRPLSFTASINPSLFHQVDQLVVGTYVQDDWKIRKDLTLNLGLRYELATVPQEVHGRYVSLPYLTAPTPNVGGLLFHNPTMRNFDPRVGFAWSPLGSSRTVVHGSFGVFDVLPLPYEMDLLEAASWPFTVGGFVTSTSALAGQFYTGGYSLLSPTTSATAFVEQNPHRNYVINWNFNVQREVTPSLAFTIGFTGSHAVHQQFKVDDSDMTLPYSTPYGWVFPFSSSGPLPTLNPNFGDIHSLWWDGSSTYSGLQVGVTKRLSKGLEFQASFAWQKSLDSSSSGAGSDSYANAISSLHWYDLSATRGLSDYDTPRQLTLSGRWDVPAPHISSGVGKTLLNGWQIGSIFNAMDGQPFTVLVGGDTLGQNSSDPYGFPDRLGGPGCGSLVNSGNRDQYIKLQCFSMPTVPNLTFWNANCNLAPPGLVDANGNQITLNHPQNPALDGAGWLPPLACFNLRGNAGRNLLLGPGFANLDFSIYKNTPLTRISERLTTQLRVEFFNVLNLQNFQAPLVNNVLFDSTGAPVSGAGALTQTTHDSREIQLALKLLW